MVPYCRFQRYQPYIAIDMSSYARRIYDHDKYSGNYVGFIGIGPNI